jgi:pimeloyl-ACP methyl ester carboxylesterase
MGVVHLGFFLAMQKVIKDFLLFTAQKPADLCGHSAGAAIILQLAVYVSVMIPDGRQRIRNVCAVAPPKVGGAEFCETFRALFSDENCRLYTRRFDPVTKFPRGKYQHPYQHQLPSKADGKFDHPIDGYIDIIDE